MQIIEIKTLLKSLADVEMIKQRQITKQPDELDTVKKNAGIKPANNAVKPPVTNTNTDTPGIANQKIALNKSKIPMGQDVQPVDDTKFSAS